jgi:putative polyhydroxyalkanoate system protein
MADVHVIEPHTLPPSEAIARVKSFEEMLSKYGVKAVWSGTTAELKGTGVSGSINVTSTAVDITVKLGFLAKTIGVDPVRLESSIRRRLSEGLRGSAS